MADIVAVRNNNAYPTHDHVEENQPEAPHVHLEVVWLALDHFWSGERRRADWFRELPGHARAVDVGLSRRYDARTEAEVGDLDVTVLVTE